MPIAEPWLMDENACEAEYSDVLNHLDEKFTEFKERFPAHAWESLTNNLYFAGGCICSLIRREKPNDYDLWQRQYWVDEASPLDLISWPCITHNARSINKFQVIIRNIGKPTEVVADFDFAHNMFWYAPYSRRIGTFCKAPLRVCLEHRLRPNWNRVRDINGVWCRIGKFTRRGWTITRDDCKQLWAMCDPVQVKSIRKERDRSASLYSRINSE